ncbi:MAG: aminotransferase class V-fold PLP-dependent enzyme [Sulfobacillus sp.]|nr:aminotransferase class V-fold PLP-dependent enzyme [Sulfobacillus sp.]
MYGHDLKLLIPAAMNRTYLNVGTLGPTPGTALAAATARELEWIESGPGQPQSYVEARSRIRQFAERIERAMPGGVVALTENNSTALLRVFWGIAFQPGDEVITTNHEHGAVVQALSSVMRRFDLKIRVVDVDAPTGVVHQIRQALSEKTRLVVVSHVSYLTGWELPIGSIAEVIQAWPQCRLLVDGAQALGNIMVDPAAIGADFYVFCGHKWMLAPAGWAGLWIRQDRQSELTTRWPLERVQAEVESLAHGPFDVYTMTGADWEYGTRPWPRITAWSIMWDYFEEEGFLHHALYQRSLAEEAQARLEAVPDLRLDKPPSSEFRQTALMTVQSQSFGSGLADILLRSRIVVKGEPRRQGIRISWAVFNTVDDLDQLIHALWAW